MSKVPILVTDAAIAGGKATYEMLRPMLSDLIDQRIRGAANIAGGVIPITTAVRDSLVSAGATGFWDFMAPIKNTLVLERGTGNPTFTRADASTCATVVDHEGIIRTVPANCARFKGARLVRNLVATKSEDFSNAAWTKTTTTATATTLTATAGNATTIAAAAITSASQAHVLRVQMSRITGTGNIQLTLDNGSTWTTVTLTGTDQVFSISQTLANPQPGIRIVTNGDAINATKIQVQEKAGASDSTVPDDYVSVGVLSSPYHGAGIDGVKYFTTTNGNTVASNVVTEATGTAIADATLKGYLSEGSRTNALKYSAKFTSGGTGSALTVTDNVATAPDGTTTAATMMETVANAQHAYNYTDATKAATNGTVYTTSCYFKSNGTRYVILDMTDESTGGAYAYFDLQTGVISQAAVAGGSWTSASATISSIGNGWYRCTVTATLGAGNVAKPAFYLQQASTGGETGTNYAGNASNGIYAWGLQRESASFASSYIPTTTAAVTRAADSDSWPTTSNFSDTAGTIYFETTAESWANASGRIVGDAAEGILASSANSGVQGYDGTNTVNGSAGSPSGQIKCAVSWSGSTMSICVNGGAVATGSYDGSWNLSAIFVGNGYFGNTRSVRIAQVAFSNAALQAITT